MVGEPGEELDERWRVLLGEVTAGLRAWRAAHPRATVREIEAAPDERLDRARARMLEEAALTSPAADLAGQAAAERPRCRTCGGALQARGQRERTVTVRGDHAVRLRRGYAVCTACGAGVSPLDEELELGPGALDPHLVEGVALLGTIAPFERVPALLAFFARVTVGAETARRLTEAAGAAQVAVEAAEADRLARELPLPPAGPAVQQLSLDGAMVPLVGGAWAEVKTPALGTVATRPGADRSPEAHTVELSYFSRLAEAEAFRHLVRVELHRRGTERAGRVCAVQDGAEWQQRVVDRYRPDAIRILDFPRAAEHPSAAAQAVFGAGTAALSEWLGAQLHELKHGDPERVPAALRAPPVAAAPDPAAAAATLAEVVGYLARRRPQLAYAEFRARGYPIGSGAVESANKLVVEARLKGSGMHWARANVTPLVALRAVLCSERWDQAWPGIGARLRRRPAQRRPRAHPAPRPPAPLPPESAPPAPDPDRSPPGRPAPPARPKLVVDRRPAPEHPWKRRFLPDRRRAS